MLRQDPIETFQLKRFCKFEESKMLAFTNDVDVVLGGVDIVPPVALASDGELPDCEVVLGGVEIALPGAVPVGLVALIRSGELPDCVVPGRKNVPDHSRVEFHKAKL